MPIGNRVFYLVTIIVALYLAHGKPAHAQLPEPTVYEPPLGYRDDITTGHMLVR